jgi:hypothetical protein
MGVSKTTLCYNSLMFSKLTIILTEPLYSMLVLIFLDRPPCFYIFKNDRRFLKNIKLAVVLLPLLIFCSHQPATGEYDYLLSTEGDIIRPPSGEPGHWVTIIGGNHTGTFYVAPNGNDDNPGTRDLPFQSIARGVNALSPGETLVILARNPDRKPVIAGERNLLAAFDIGGCHHLRIENLEITSTRRSPFREGITGTSAPVSNIVLQDLDLHHLDEFGIDIADAESLAIINCRITWCGFGAIGGPAGVAGGWRQVLISGCDLSYSGHYYQGGDGTNRPYDRPDGFGIEASAGPIEIVNTTASHNYGDGLDSKARHTWIHECLVANNSCDGVKLWGDSSRLENTLIYGRGDGNAATTPWSPLVISTENPARFEIVNCTIDDTLGDNYLFHCQYDQPNIPVTIVIVNTIFSSRGTNAPAIWLATAVSAELRHNLFYSPRDGRLLIQGDSVYNPEAVSRIGPGNIYANPQFIAPAWATTGDYHLSGTSPAIDAGDPVLAPAVDLDRRSRPRSAGFDIGCYEQ